MSLYLVAAGMTVNPLVILGAAVAAGAVSGLMGTGGGFLLTPLMMLLGVPPAVAVASGCNQVVAASCPGALAHRRLGHIDVKMGLIFLSGAVLGSTMGTHAVKFMSGLGQYDFAVRAAYVVVLALIGGSMFRDGLRVLRHPAGSSGPPYSRIKGLLARLPLHTEFPVSGVRASILFVAGLGFITGLLAAALGVGGGFLAIPAMIRLLGVPVLVAVGTGLFQIVFTGVSATFQQALTNHTVDLALAALLFAGATVGGQIGACGARFFRAPQLRLFLAVAVLMLMAAMLVTLLAAPAITMTFVQAEGRY